MTTDSAPTPEGESSVPDEVWEQFLTDNERDIRASAPKEPSARARIVARRLREQEEQAAAVRAARPKWRLRRRRTVRSAPRTEHTAWRTGRTDEGERRLLRRSRVRGLIAVVLLVVVLLIVLSPSHAWSLVTGRG
jgi:Flp pilus assembly protein TadB